MVLAVEFDVAVALGEEIRKFGRDLDLGDPVDHEQADADQEQAYRQAPAQNEFTDTAQAFGCAAFNSFHHSGGEPEAQRIAPSGLTYSLVDGLHSLVNFGCQRCPPCIAPKAPAPGLTCDEGLLSVIQ